jgi:hypothetical protein
MPRGANHNPQLKLFPPYRSLRMDRGADSILDIGTRGKFRTELDALATTDALLAAGAAVDERDARGRTRLHYADAAGYTDVAKLLAERGADPQAADSDGVTPLDAANASCEAEAAAPGTAYPATAAALGELLAPR